MSDPGLVFPLVSRHRVGGLPFGALRSRTRGGGYDLAGARPYLPGDDVRRIDWRASARISSARGAEEFVVREHHAEEATRVVVLVDRRPSLALFPGWSPFLHKPEAIVEAGTLILDSALRGGCLVGYLDDADRLHADPAKRAESPFWRAPAGAVDSWRIRERYLPYGGFHAPATALADGLEHLLGVQPALPPGSFVFVISDFTAPLPVNALDAALRRGLDVVAVVVQDPVWEQSFPDISGVIVPFADPAGGIGSPVRLSRSEVRDRRSENEARLRGLMESLDELGMDAVLVSSADRGEVLGSFLDWADGRYRGARLAR